MTSHRVYRVSVLVSGGLLLFILFLYLFFPVGRLNARIDGLLADQGLQLSPGAVKSVIPGLSWTSPDLSSSQGALLHFDSLSLHPSWQSLLTGNLAVSSHASINKGRLDILYGVTGSRLLTIGADRLALNDIPFFRTVLGAQAAGELWTEGIVMRDSGGIHGDVRLEIKNLGLNGVKLGMFPLPDVSGLTAQGMVKISGGKARLESFTIQGEGIYMRLSGDLPGGSTALSSPLNLSLEIMPKPEFLEKQKLVFMLMAKFAASPGVYKIPVSGSLLKPVIL